jgi:hypothetical protein
LGYAQHDETALNKKSSMNMIKVCQDYAKNEFPNETDDESDPMESENDENSN